jgi:Host cell surface-exposed lipoprotein
MFWGEDELTYPEDYGQPPQSQYTQQGYGQHARQDEPWHPQQNDPFAYMQRTAPKQQGPVGQQNPWEPQPWGQPNPQQQPYGQPWPPQDQQGAPQPPPWQQSVMPPQMPKGQKRKSWPARHKALSGLIAFGALVVVIIAAASSSASNKPSTTAADVGAAVSSASPSAAVSSAAASSAPSTPAAPASPSMTGGQQQAVDSAESYLSEGQGFSKQGLLNQLTSSFGEGFSKSDAEFAIKYLKPNWDKQAVDAAKGYLGDGEGFSRSSLIQQLTSSYGDGFTESQAEYGVNQAMP